MTTIKPDGIGKAGAILNIIGSVFLILFFFWTIVFLIFPLFSIIYNAKFLNNYAYKTRAGVWGLLFGGIIGGIFVLVSEEGQKIEIKEEKKEDN